MNFEKLNTNPQEEEKDNEKKEGEENKEIIPQDIDDKIEDEASLLKDNLEELESEIEEIGGEEALNEKIQAAGEEKIKQILNKIKDTAKNLKDSVAYATRVYGGSVLASSLTIAAGYATLAVPDAEGAIGAGLTTGVLALANAFSISNIKDIKENIKTEAKEEEEKKNNLWENLDHPEWANQGLIKFNSKGLTAEFKDGTKIKGKMQGDLLKFHNVGYHSRGDNDHGFSGYSVESVDENSEVIKLYYPHAVPSGGDFASYSSYVKATIDKKNKTVTFEADGGSVTS